MVDRTVQRSAIQKQRAACCIEYKPEIPGDDNDMKKGFELQVCKQLEYDCPDHTPHVEHNKLRIQMQEAQTCTILRGVTRTDQQEYDR